mmetsp:Transcript_5455/g.12442  ORF Transcript_5455/g.12442 Transcript_5455/m.12442 type:complete len:100 (-) Transcript_5455:532-831(-)
MFRVPIVPLYSSLAISKYAAKHPCCRFFLSGHTTQPSALFINCSSANYDIAWDKFGMMPGTKNGSRPVAIEWCILTNSSNLLAAWDHNTKATRSDDSTE